MATFEERARIIRDSQQISAFNTDYVSPFEDSDTAAVRSAASLFRRVTAALSDIATEIRTNAAAGLLQDPSTPPQPGREMDMFLWARDYATGDAPAAFRMILDQFDGLTPAQLFNPVTATDVAIRQALVDVAVPVLALGVAKKR